MKRDIVLFLAGLFLIAGGLAAGQPAAQAQIGNSNYSYRDPFESLLPEPITALKNNQQGLDKKNFPAAAVSAAKPLSLSIEGVLWGTDKPLAIINGEVYRIGDTIKNLDVRIYDIQKNKVLIVYDGRLQEFGVNVKKDEEKSSREYGASNKRKQGGRK